MKRNTDILIPHYRFLLAKFEDWMQIMGYKPNSINAYILAVDEFFQYLQQIPVLHITAVGQEHLTSFKNYLLHRSNRQVGYGGITAHTINAIIKAVNCFANHINQTSDGFKLDIYESYLPIDQTEKVILTIDEVKELYDATFTPYRIGSMALGQRDRVMLGLLYGCGLRLNEARHVDIHDIDFTNNRVHVRYGKRNKERFVPIPNQHLADIKTYIQDGREWLRYHHKDPYDYHRPRRKRFRKIDEDALMLNEQGNRLKAFNHRLDYLQKRTSITKKVRPHALRHSVATHLLMGGFTLKQVAKFLGHSSTESTQIYTHIAAQLSNEDYDGKRDTAV